MSASFDSAHEMSDWSIRKKAPFIRKEIGSNWRHNRSDLPKFSKTCAQRQILVMMTSLCSDLDHVKYLIER